MKAAPQLDPAWTWSATGYRTRSSSSARPTTGSSRINGGRGHARGHLSPSRRRRDLRGPRRARHYPRPPRRPAAVPGRPARPGKVAAGPPPGRGAAVGTPRGRAGVALRLVAAVDTWITRNQPSDAVAPTAVPLPESRLGQTRVTDAAVHP
jgi:hypothetical protein